MLGLNCQAGEERASSPVLLIGDSMMRLPGLAVERELARLPGVEAHTFSGIGTGLARLDAFDWLGKIDELCEQHRPKTVVVALGANDRQPMQLPGGSGIVQPDSYIWAAEYAKRIGQALDRFAEGGVEQIIWLLLPPMRDTQVDQHARRLNTLLEEEAKRRPQLVLYDLGKLFADRRGGYTERIIDPQTAAAIPVRDRDGIHLTPQGARLLARALIDQYWTNE